MDFQAKLNDLEARVSTLESRLNQQVASVTGTPNKKVAPKEFLLRYVKSSVIDKTLLLSYYFEYVQGDDEFNVDDIVSLFRAAKEKQPANINDIINKNIKKGFMMESINKKSGKKAWVLTSTGETYVQDKLNNKMEG